MMRRRRTRPPADTTPAKEKERPSIVPPMEPIRKPLSAGVIAAPRRSFSVSIPGRAPLVLGPRTLVMGVINVTPDSFSDGGKAFDPAHALDVALAMEACRRRPHRPRRRVDAARREAGRGRRGTGARGCRCCGRWRPASRCPISIDTYKAAVAAAALDEGALIVNDISGFEYDPDMGPVVASRAACRRC